MNEPYLLRLADRIASGLAKGDSDWKARHRAFLTGQQKPDGGFGGRMGDSDLYYTAFAVRSLAVLGGPTETECASIARFLRSTSAQRVNVVDLVSWLYSALVILAAGGPNVVETADEQWTTRLAEMLESFRAADGGYAKSHEGKLGSTYHSFLVALCYELIGLPLPNADALVKFIRDRQRDDGGFVEIQPMKRSGTNPTAAAVAVLRMFDQIDDSLRSDVRDFLLDVRSPEGGFQANTRIPFADGLSTFTALLTCRDLRLEGVIDAQAVLRFVQDLEFPGGGFRGALWDETADVEYTFYGLGVLGLLGAD